MSDLALLEQAERDALLDRCRAAPDELRARLVLGWWQLDGALATRLERVDHPLVNRVIGLGATMPVRRAAVEWLLGAYRAAGLKRFALQMAGDAPPWLAELGLSATAREDKMWRIAAPTPEPVCVLEIRPAQAKDAAALGRITAAAAGLPAPLGLWTAALVGRPGWQAYLAWDGGQPVAAALLYVKGELGWLGGDATLPSHRGRGAQSALIAHRVDAAAQAGARLLAAETSPQNRNWAAAGFQVAYARESFTQTA